jgi:Tol biopolymer transport system component
VSIRTPLRMLTLVLAAAALATACSGGGNGTASAPAGGRTGAPGGATAKPGGGTPSEGEGSLIVTSLTGLVEYNIKSGNQKPLIKPATDNTFLLDPAISPDGKRLAYVVQPPPVIEAGKYDAGSDLWVANRDGSDAHVIFTHVQSNQLVRFPQWQDNDTILVIVQEIDTTNGVTNVSYVLERIAAAGGERTHVLNDVLSFGLTPDSKGVVYARLAPQTGETLNVAALDGSSDTVLVGIDQNLSPFNVPRYSPDGKTIAFASADQTGARAASPEYVSAAFGPQPAPSLDGLPEDIWTVPVTGGTPVRVADIKEDLPALTWGPDGKHIYVIGSAGLYDVNLTTGSVNRLGDGAFHGQIVWAP